MKTYLSSKLTADEYQIRQFMKAFYIKEGPFLWCDPSRIGTVSKKYVTRPMDDIEYLNSSQFTRHDNRFFINFEGYYFIFKNLTLRAYFLNKFTNELSYKNNGYASFAMRKMKEIYKINM